MPVVLYQSWRDFPQDQWRWPSFGPDEMACRGTGQLIIDEKSLDMLQELRDLLGKPIIVNSAYRSPTHNKRVGGAANSQHLKARAYDCSMENHDPEVFEQAARQIGFTGFGYYVKQNFMHIDTGPARVWGKPFPPRPVMPPVETEEDPEAPIPAERFRPEPKRPTILESLAKPEVLAPVGGTGFIGLAMGFIELVKGSVPLQIAVGALLIGVPLGIAVWLVVRNRSVRTGD